MSITTLGEADMAKTIGVYKVPLFLSQIFPGCRPAVRTPSSVQMSSSSSPTLPSSLLALFLPLPLDPPSPSTPPPRFSPHGCRIWQIYQPIAALLLTVAVDTVLILKGYFHPNIH